MDLNTHNNKIGLFYSQIDTWIPTSTFAPKESESCRITILPEQLTGISPAKSGSETCPFFFILFPTKSSGKYIIDNLEYDINDNILFLSSEKLPLFFELHEYKGEILSFSEELLQMYNLTIYHHIKFYLLNDENIHIFSIESKKIKSVLFEILEHVKIELSREKEMGFHLEYIASLLSLFFVFVARACDSKNNLDLCTNTCSYKTFVAFKKAVETDFMTKHLVKDYATDLNISLNTLHLHINEYSNISPSMIIDNRIILEAKKLLLFTSNSAKEVAFILGFEDPSHFSKFFKKHVGILPNTFKKSRGEKSL